MKCIVKLCPSDGFRPITITLPKGTDVGRHEVLAETFTAQVPMCLRHHKMFVAHQLAGFSIRKAEP